MITLIAAIGKNFELGFKNKLPWHISEDLKHFKSYTTGKVVVMGSNTFASIGHKAMPGRKTIVISTQDLAGMAVRAKNIEDILSIEHCYPELVIIGGESVYRQTIQYADKLVITHIDSTFEADTFFPRFDLTNWEVQTTMTSSDKLYQYTFVEYIRKK